MVYKNDDFEDEQIDKECYDVDHFIPWSIVMNDELWNLMPIDSSFNSSKSNSVLIRKNGQHGPSGVRNLLKSGIIHQLSV